VLQHIPVARLTVVATKIATSSGICIIKDDAGLDVKICRIHFHEPWSTSWHNSEISYYDPDGCQYDIMIKTVSDVDRSTKCELTVRPKP
jgi:hypothetical protein